MHRGPDNGVAPPHASRKLKWIAVLESLQSHKSDQGPGPIHVEIRLKAKNMDGHHHVLKDNLPRKKDRILKNHANLARGPIDLSSANPDTAVRPGQQPGDDLEKSRFPAATGSYNGYKFPFLDFKRAAPNGRNFTSRSGTIGFSKLANLDNRIRIRQASSPLF
jgi:hypothetical protein